ncbi:MAG TPA: sugar transferase [Candidatus Paceibacterota bacterium]
MDITGSLIGLVFISALYPFAAIMIKLDSPGPALIKLPRISRGKMIYVYKFRSMRHNAHPEKKLLRHLNERKDGSFFKISNDPRITRVGRILRKWHIDEFPQLINVLKGELSLVGPRPHEPEEMYDYPAPYRHLLLAKAGITGLSQVNGASGLPFLRELELDSAYLRQQSLLLDLKILFKTLYIFFFDPNGI